ncbi:MAG: deoxyguanosinetriphosphate triphosphohydrolase [Cyclobacteriaceae bacterium]|nr:deoxyguanosinetriphosphate triphosphohydrolase [Cyclobacteriaceae bacterium HetDA_MAG_MS6]
MDWTKLLSAKRYGETSGSTLAETRSRFDQDYDRIIFSHPFRKLQDKTQVFPLPEDDFVHTRLTHSMEVSSVGRSLGKEVGKHILAHNPELQKQALEIHDFGAIVAAASLTHDLGNPPFGHSGEDGISSFFRNTATGRRFRSMVSQEEWQDLTHFEGNAQGFRILNNPMYGGLRLTYATLAAFTKYPRNAAAPKDSNRRSQKKFGYYQSEIKVFQEMAQEMGLRSLAPGAWVRHPLAFLVEAADDICYHIIDLEDGCRLGLVDFDTTIELYAAIIGNRFSREKLNKMDGLNEKIGLLRAMTISQLVKECVACFLDNEASILSADFDTSLVDHIPSKDILGEVISLSVQKIYRSKQVLEREAAGFEIIEKLMEGFTDAVYHQKFAPSNNTAKLKSIYRLIPEEYSIALNKDLSVYDSLMVVTDFISGLTDSSAVKLYKIIRGYTLPFSKH